MVFITNLSLIQKTLNNDFISTKPNTNSKQYNMFTLLVRLEKRLGGEGKGGNNSSGL
jgi:hypothetical protein